MEINKELDIKSNKLTVKQPKKSKAKDKKYEEDSNLTKGKLFQK